MNQRFKYITISLLSCCYLLAGCNSVKKTLGIDRDAPDEFAVNPSSLPLEMPPDFYTKPCKPEDLPKPNPGQPRPQELKKLEEDKKKLISKNPNQASPNGKSLSQGQKTILEMAGVQEGQDHVRKQIDDESRIKNAEGKPVLEKLGIQKTKEKEVINPHTEASDLQNKGIPQTPQQKQN